MTNRFNQALALPFQTTLSFAKIYREATDYLHADISKERNLAVIPYNNPPLVKWRAQLRSLPLWIKWAIGLSGSFATLLILFACIGYVFHAIALARSVTIQDLIILSFMNIACISLGVLNYSLFGIQDYIVSDRFSLFVPPALFQFRDLRRVQKGYTYRNYWIYLHRVYWSDLQELSIVDMGKLKGHRFCLKLSGKSGSEITVPIKNLPKASIKMLTNEIEKNAPFCRNLSQLAELSRFQDYENGLLPLLTYTQLWESLTAKRIDATSFAPLQPNTKLQNGRLTIVHQIASGGFSAVYLTEETDGTKFVLKEFVLPFGAEPELVKKASEHFAREARLLRSLQHEQIARVYDHFIEDNRNYLLIEYIQGQTLRQIVHEEGQQSEEKVLSYAIQIAEILQYLHNQNIPIIHRDLTPDNLILSPRGKLFLIDFGSANEFVGNATGTLVGKHAYMAPEQIRGKAAPASDIYSFGQTLYYCLSGSDPLPLLSSSLAQAESNLANNLNRLITQCTNLEIEQRPKLSEILSRLLQYGNGQRAQI